MTSMLLLHVDDIVENIDVNGFIIDVIYVVDMVDFAAEVDVNVDVAPGKDKPMVMTRTLVFLDCLAATTTDATVGGGGGDARLQERTVLMSGSSVSRVSWGEVEITAAATVDTTRGGTTRGDTTKDTTRDTTKEAQEDRAVVSATTS